MKIGSTQLRVLTRDDVTFTVECLNEDVEIDGEFDSGDLEADKKTLAWMREQLDAGNQWAWCCIKVICTWETLHAAEYLGCASYASESDFRNDAYFADMCDEALDRLNAQIGETAALLGKLVIP